MNDLAVAAERRAQYEATITFMLNALPEPIADAFFKTISRPETCKLDWVNGEHDEFLRQVFISYMYDEGADACDACGEIMHDHEEFEREGSWHSGPAIVIVCPKEL